MTTTDVVPATRPRPPRPVRIATGAVFAGVAVYLLGGLVNVVVDLAHPARTARQAHVSPGTATAGMAIAGVILIGICALTVLLAVRMRRGSSSARTTLVVLATLSLAAVVASAITGHLAHAGVLVLIVEILCAAAEIVFVVAAFHRETRAFLA